MTKALSSFQADGLVKRQVTAVEVKIKAKGIQFLRGCAEVRRTSKAIE
jgi:hypothetical protein